MDEQSEPAERRLSLQPRHEVVGEGDALEGRAEHELAGVEDERAAVVHLDDLGQVLLRELRVDVRRGVVAEDAEVAVDVQVDRRRLHVLLVDRLDDDALGRQGFFDRTVGEDHEAGLYRSRVTSDRPEPVHQA